MITLMDDTTDRETYRVAADRYMAAWRDGSIATDVERETALDALVKADVWCGGCDRQ